MSDHATALAELEAEIDQHDEPGDLVMLATTIDHFGRQLAQELQRVIAEPARADPLKPILLAVPAVHVRALLKAAQKLDDAGSPRRAARVLVEALHRAFDADKVSVVAGALGFTLVAFEQRAAADKLELLLALDPVTPRRERRARHLALVDELAEAIEWDTLDDKLGAS
jgi:hypothetical protein